MKCLYYLAPTLVSARDIARDLDAVGVQDWLIHVIARDDRNLRRESLHGGNYLETTDVLRNGLIGAGLGLSAAVFAVFAVYALRPLGQTPSLGFLGLIGLSILVISAGVGALSGLDRENRKIRRFHQEIEAGQYLVLIYAAAEQDPLVRDVMARAHPESVLAAVDHQFFNPFGRIHRRAALVPEAGPGAGTER